MSEAPKDIVEQLIDNTEKALQYAVERLAKVEAETAKRKAQVVQLQKSLAILKDEKPPSKEKRKGVPWTQERRDAMAEQQRRNPNLPSLRNNGAVAVA